MEIRLLDADEARARIPELALFFYFLTLVILILTLCL